MRFFIYSIFLLFSCQSTFSQGFGVLEGRILKASNQTPYTEPVITMPTAGFNTSVNSEGYFKLVYPNIAADSLLIIGGVGYETINTTPAELLANDSLTILLDSLQMIDISLGLSDAKVLVAAAIDSIAANYPSSAFKQEGFFLETAKLDKVGYVDIKEAQIRVERFPQEKVIKTKSRLLASQKVNWEGQHNKVAAFGFENSALLVSKSLETEIPAFLTKKKRRQYEFNIDSLMVPFLDENLLVVSFKPSKPNLSGGREGKLYIDPYTKVIVRIDYLLTDKSMSEIFGSGLSNVKIKGERIASYTQYAPYRGTWVLSDSRIDFRARFEERLDKKFNTLADFQVRFVPFSNTFFKKSSISEFNAMTSTQGFKVSKMYNVKAWDKKFCIPATSAMPEINQRLTDETE